MASERQPVPRTVSSGDGTAQTFTSRMGDDGVPPDVVRRRVTGLNIHDTSGADNSVTIAERDVDNGTDLRTWTFEVAANGSLTFAEDEIPGIVARRTRALRASGDGGFDAEIEFVDEN